MSKRAPYPVREPWPGSPQYWRNLEERAQTGDAASDASASPSARNFDINGSEFPKGHVETPPTEEAWQVSRRGLLGAMAATFAMVGAEGCRRPIEKIVPYAKMPEDVIPGVPSHYSTVIQRRGDAVGLVVESHEGRPTKIEGNEQHPASFGGADLVTQATILELYDPERSTGLLKARAPSTWADFDRELTAKLGDFDRDQGSRFRLLMPPTLSPTVIRMRTALAQRFPKARVHTWSAVSDSNTREGARIALGQPATPLYGFDRARVIVSLDSDFLQTETGNVRWMRLFASGRRMRSAKDQMNRLYVVEPSPTTTGANADHRLRLPAAAIEGYAYALGAELAKHLGTSLDALHPLLIKQANAEGIAPKWVETVAKDLVTNRGRALIVVGARQPARVHALAFALNQALGAFETCLHFATATDADELDAETDMRALADAIGGGQVDALVILGGNPVYDAPADLAFGEKLAKVPFTVHASLFVDETSDKCTWHVPRAHEFESWGDGRSLEGGVAVQQPLIAPLYAGRSDIELLALMSNAAERTGYDAVRGTARELSTMAHDLTCGPFVDGKSECHDPAGRATTVSGMVLEREWSRGLASGSIYRAKAAIRDVNIRAADVASAMEKAVAVPRPSGAAFEVTFAPCPKMVDGRYANLTWLQELPDPVTKIVWDNVAVLSPATARALGVSNKDILRITANGRSINVAAWIVPGQADGSIALTLGWGRTKAGRIGNGRGFDVYPLRTTGSLGFVAGAAVAKTGESYFVAQTQEHNSTEHRPIAHEATLADYRARPNFAELDNAPQRALPLWSQVDYSKGHQWGMTIDLSTCTGCSACMIACMAENNVPVVGKTEVWRGREMHWLRVDRYWVDDAALGGTVDDPLTIHEPLMCVHCEEAPCENVCPVNATEHGPEGLNEMAYNRCIGTRYCANNCPYKVRKFNYLNWHNDVVWKETGGLPETLQMQQNPNVTVRFRGVMEKCSYCVQRIQSSKLRAKRELREVRDGEIKTACQQTCPAGAIVFGDINDPNSQVTTWSRVDRRFGLLQELGTRPRTTYLGKVRNPNPEMA
jgi:Fe-S-cluster-containing dehydrogenase component